MKFVRFLLFVLMLVPMTLRASTSDFTMAAQLLAAAKSADIQQVQALVNNGANINFVDSTGLSIVCTALMNNDLRAAQILQMYGADASRCDIQIKRYNNRNRPKSTGGLFSGLSSAQSLTLAAAGAAVVAGGLFLLTDVLDPGNENSNSGGTGGDRPNQGGDGGSGGGTGGASMLFSVPYGPAYLEDGDKINPNSTVFAENLDGWNPSAGGIRELDFNFFRPTMETETGINKNSFLADGIDLPVQNYLLMMHGYSAFANEYMGQKIFRVSATKNPMDMQNDAGGGLPVSVRIVTDNGLNPTGSATRADGISYALSTAANSEIFTLDKYLNYNNPVNGVLGSEKTGFDLSGAGTAMNPYANAYDSALGKIIAGWAAGERAYGDFFGFVPYGQLGVYRTGAGKEWAAVENPTSEAAIGTIENGQDGKTNAIDVGDKIVLDDITYEISSALTNTEITEPTITVNGVEFAVADDSSLLKGVCTSENPDDCAEISDIAIYSDANGNFYVNKTGGNNADMVLMVDGGNLYASKTLQDADYKNFQALYKARSDSASNYGVIANLSVLDVARNRDYKTVADMPALIALGTGNSTDVYANQIDLIYDKNNNDLTSQGGYANTLFTSYNGQSPILVMPAGDFKFGTGQGVKDATFENYAPLLYGTNLEHNFMTVVAVMHSKGTSAADSIEDYGNGTADEYGKLYLSIYQDGEDVYSSRQCGVAGTGQGNIDPWCFASAGATAEMATASAAGAVASVKAAFDYMSNKDVFYLLALTADGHLLGTNSDGTPFTQESLAAYLRNMYSLPPEYYDANNALTASEYLDAFAKVYGYGLINLDRAMKPNHTIYYYDGNAIVSASGNAYWRNASSTMFRPSNVLNLRGASVRAPFFDVVESLDGQLTMPRVWGNEFVFGVADKRGLYMGDVLGELKTVERDDVFQLGDFTLSMAFSEKPYFDALNGLDRFNISYDYDDWKFAATYQKNLTDNLSRFDAMVNPILGLASDAITADVNYGFGNFTVGTRLFSGVITDEELLENDPTVSAQYMPTKLGLAQGGVFDFSWADYGLNLKTSVGFLAETDTLLGAYSDGLLDLGNGNTTFVDFIAGYDFADNYNLKLRTTFAKTSSDALGDFVMGLSDVVSNSFAISAKLGNFEFSASQPLAITSGQMKYAYADYSVDEQDGKYVLNINDTHIETLGLRPQKREFRLSGTYRHKFGTFTDGVFGFIYRVNPNHTDDFGDESIFMLKLTHRLGI
ncbi:MAG: ankyrin repeat domain-containing protein [Alphaproteobacteria bacterium]|nr:ankyrin repeat domain-containing protein [Alphaproteobacteria bacterium]